MSNYKKQDPRAKWAMRIRSTITLIWVTSVLALVRTILHRLDLLSLSHLRLADGIYLIILCLLVMNVLLFPQIRYNRCKYEINADHADVVTGLIRIQREIVPISRVQKVEMTSGPIDRRFGLSNVVIDTAAGATEIRYLTTLEAEAITVNLEELLKQKLENSQVGFLDQRNSLADDIPVSEETLHEKQYEY